MMIGHFGMKLASTTEEDLIFGILLLFAVLPFFHISVNSQKFFILDIELNLHSHQQCTRALFSLHPHTPTPLNPYVLRTPILTSVMWYLSTALICISLMISDMEHLFTCLLVIYMSSLETCLFRFSVHFLIRLFVFLAIKLYELLIYFEY